MGAQKEKVYEEEGEEQLGPLDAVWAAAWGLGHFAGVGTPRVRRRLAIGAPMARRS